MENNAYMPQKASIFMGPLHNELYIIWDPIQRPQQVHVSLYHNRPSFYCGPPNGDNPEAYPPPKLLHIPKKKLSPDSLPYWHQLLGDAARQPMTKKQPVMSFP
ncbi:hypothetical protein Adt_23208 [Abeliophyllum distichum]|uniref:Uncharacterized protein n=1 Tax=Abeliophyllum distichum TaxID=126358 RepID=A0ABD1SA80_9LAMI